MIFKSMLLLKIEEEREKEEGLKEGWRGGVKHGFLLRIVSVK